MVRTLATLGFIGAVAAGAILLAREPTVARGAVMSDHLLNNLRARGITKVACDDRIPIDRRGAVFVCDVDASDGSRAKIRYTLDRAQQFHGELIEGTPPTRSTTPTSGDPWGGAVGRATSVD